MMRVYGPYERKQDGRKIVIIIYDDGTRTTKSYARFLYENEHGGLSSSYDVDHIDENPYNDENSNFQPLTRSENIKKAWREGKHKEKEWFEGICSECNHYFRKEMRYVNGNKKKGKAGPFCSRKCAGKYSTRAYANR